MISMLVSVLWLGMLAQSAGTFADTSDQKMAEPVDLPAMKAEIHHGTHRWTLIINFQAIVESAEQFRTKPGIVMHGRGEGRSVTGEVMADAIDITFHLADVPVADGVVELPDGVLIAGLADAARPLIRIGPARADGSREGTAVFFAAKSFSHFVLNRAWNERLGPDDSTVIAARLLDLVVDGTVSEARSAACSPSSTECFNMPVSACEPYGIGTFNYSCNPETGEVNCGFTCKGPPGGGQ